MRLQIKPVRRCLTWFLIIFRAVDREQDRPYTNLWGVSQTAVGCVPKRLAFSFAEAACHRLTEWPSFPPPPPLRLSP